VIVDAPDVTRRFHTADATARGVRADVVQRHPARPRGVVGADLAKEAPFAIGEADRRPVPRWILELGRQRRHGGRRH
jgi:hypothetical protein